MEGVFLRLKFKLFFIFYFLGVSLFAIEIMSAKHEIGYNTRIALKDVYMKTYVSKPPACVLFDSSKLKNLKNNYLAKHYILKSSPICKKDIYLYKSSKVFFDFGNIVIEKNGKIIYENDKLVRIREPNGKIDTIYKQGISE